MCSRKRRVHYESLMFCRATKQLRDFETLRRELENLVLLLKTAKDAANRRQLLRKLRAALKEADHLNLLVK